MEVVASILRSQEGGVVGILLGSFIVVKLLRLSSSISLIAATTPFALYLLDTPVVEHLRSEYPILALCGAWLSTAVVGALARGIMPAWHSLVGPIGIFRLGYIVAMATALLFVVALFVAPDLLTSFAPEWRSTVGGSLLAVSVLSMSRAVARLLKAGMVLAVWSGVALVLACQVFLQKMPQALDRRDVAKLHRLLGSEAAGQIVTSVYNTLSQVRGLSALLARVNPVVADVENPPHGTLGAPWAQNAGLLFSRSRQDPAEPEV
jgi:hypothetical protein